MRRIGDLAKPVLFASALCAVLAGRAHAASFPCKLARSPEERAICASPALGKLEEQLAAVYRAKLTAASPALAHGLRADEADWLQFVHVSCEAIVPQPTLTLADCMAGEYRERLEVLRRRPAQLDGVPLFTRTKEFAAPIPTAERMEGDPSHYTALKASWPVADTPDPGWQAWNAAVEAQVRSLSKPEGRPGANWNASWAEGTDGDVRTDIEYFGPLLVTAHIENDWMGHGAAHPNESWMNFHWLRSQGRELRVEDVFQPKSGWQKVLVYWCAAGLRRQEENSDKGTAGYGGTEEAKAMLDVVASPRNWILDDTGLTVSFPEYTVAPRASDPDPVTVPWEALRPYLAPTFVQPTGRAQVVGGIAGGAP